MSEHDFDVARDGHVHVCATMCETCVFRPGNPMRLKPGRLKGMIADAATADTAIVCHSTLPQHPKSDGHQAVCRGYYDRHRRDSLSLRLAMALDRVRFVPPPA